MQSLRVVLLCTFSAVAFAQDPAAVNALLPITTPAPYESEIEPDFPLATPVEAVTGKEPALDFAGKTDYYLKSIFSPEALARLAVTTTFNPVDGISGGGLSYTESVGARYAETLTRKTLQFSVGALRGEDPRFRRSGKEGIWARTAFVASRTFLVDMDNGSTSIAAGKLIGTFGANMMSEYWQEPNPSPWKRGLTSAGVNLAGDFGMRLLREFWPDIKSKFKK